MDESDAEESDDEADSTSLNQVLAQLPMQMRGEVVASTAHCVALEPSALAAFTATPLCASSTLHTRVESCI